MANIPLKSIKFPGLDDTYTVPQVDDTLSAAGKAADAKKTGDEFASLKSALDNFKWDCGYAPIPLQMGKSIVNNTSSVVIIPSNISNENGYCCLCVPCQKGDVYSVTGTGGNSTRLWAFSDANGVRIDGSLGNASATDLVLTAPEGSAYFSFNSKTTNGIVYSVYSGKKPIRRFEEIDGRIDANTEDIEKLYTNSENHAQAIIDITTPTTTEITTTRTDSTHINNQGVVASASASFYTLSADVSVGGKYVVNGFASQNGYLYIFVDANGNTIYKSTEKGGTGGTIYSEIIATAPDGATKLIVVGHISTGKAGYIGVLTGYAIPDIKTIPTAEVGIIPAIAFPHYPMVDSVNQKIRIMDSTTIIDRRTSNKKYYVCPETVIDYSGFTTSAIAIYFDVANSEFIAAAYNDTRNAESYLLFMLIRESLISANHITVSAAFPVMIDGMLDGVVYSKNQNVRSVNHRGLEQVAPENTLIAYQYSKMAGFDCVETDVRFTADGVPVLLHDDTINRTARNADGTTLTEDLAIADITYEEALTYDFGIWKNERFAGQKIPTFEQFIRACRNLGLHPYIELKVGTEEQIKALNTIVIRNGMQGKVTWISYNIGFLEYIHAVDENARLGVITSTMVFSEAYISRILALKGSNEVFVDADNANVITSARVEGLITLGLPLELYTGTIANIVNADPYVTGFTLGAFNAGKELIAHYDAVD